MRLRTGLSLALAVAVLPLPHWSAAALSPGRPIPQPAHQGDERSARHPIPAFDWWLPATNIADLAHLELAPQSDAATRGYRDPTTTRSLSEVLQEPGTDCWYASPFLGFSEGAKVEMASLDDLVADSAAVALGTVSGIQGGYHTSGGAGLLVQVEVRTWLQLPADRKRPRVVHIFYPRGRFRVGSVSVCAQADGYPLPPALDAEILLFAGWLGDHPDYLPVQPWRIAFEASGEVSAAERLRALPEFRTLRFVDLKRWTRAATTTTRRG